MKPVLLLESIQKSYSGRPVLQDLSFDLQEGEVLCLLGPNGAGKSTTMAILSGMLTPDQGRVEILGGDPRSKSVRLQVGATPQDLEFPSTLRVEEVLHFVGAHFPNPLPAHELIERFGLSELRRRSAKALSGGERRRLAMACAFVGRPRLVMLDEPTTGLDVQSRRALWSEVHRAKQEGVSILLTTHYLGEAEALADRIALMNQGRLFLSGTVQEITDRVGYKKVRFYSAEEVPALAGETSRSQKDNLYEIFAADADQLLHDLITKDIRFWDISVERASLEEAFLLFSKGNL